MLKKLYLPLVLSLLSLTIKGQNYIEISFLSDYPAVVTPNQTDTLKAYLKNVGSNSFASKVNIWMQIGSGSPVLLTADFQPSSPVQPGDSVLWTDTFTFTSTNFSGGINDILVWPEGPSQTTTTDSAEGKIYYADQAAFLVSRDQVYGLPNPFDPNSSITFSINAENVGAGTSTAPVEFWCKLDNGDMYLLGTDINPVNSGDFANLSLKNFRFADLLSTNSSLTEIRSIELFATENLLTSPPVSSASYASVTATGVADEQFRDDIRIYPVPAQDKLHIEARVKVTGWSIMNAAGKLVRKSDKGEQEIAVGDLPAGRYFIRIESEKGESTYSFVKQ